MTQRLAAFALLVRDYDEAIAFFTERLGFRLLEDDPMSAEKRWVRIAPPGTGDAGLLLARATTPAQQAAIVGGSLYSRTCTGTNGISYNRSHSGFVSNDYLRA